MIHKNLAAETLIPHSRAQGMTNYTVCGARELNCMGKVCVTPNNWLQKVSVIMVLATKLSRSLATKNRKFPRDVFTWGNLSRTCHAILTDTFRTMSRRAHRPNLFKVISPLSFFFFFSGRTIFIKKEWVSISFFQGGREGVGCRQKEKHKNTNGSKDSVKGKQIDMMNNAK